MKKLMIALGAVACAISLQAATASWATPYIAFAGQSDSDEGAYTYKYAIVEYLAANYSSTAFDSVKFDGNSVAGLGEGMSATTPTLSDPFYVGDGLTGTLTGAAGNWYALVVYQDDNKLWGISDAVQAAVDPGAVGEPSLQSMSFKNDTIWGETAMVANQAVPEPTSGLLLLLGVAGLALRRRRA